MLHRALERVALILLLGASLGQISGLIGAGLGERAARLGSSALDADNPAGCAQPAFKEALAKCDEAADGAQVDDPFAALDDDALTCARLRSQAAACALAQEEGARPGGTIAPVLATIVDLLGRAGDERALDAILLLLIGAGLLLAGLRGSHFSFAHPNGQESVPTPVSTLVSGVVLALLAFSMSSHLGASFTRTGLLWALALGAAALVAIVRGLGQLRSHGPGGFSGPKDLPIFVWLASLGLTYFWAVEGYLEGPAVYLLRLSDTPRIYLSVCLFLWAGMLIGHTPLVDRIFGVLAAFRLSPGLWSLAAVALCAYPTAYTGASGIFVLAAGSALYREARASGADPSLALATTAMAGSGTFLRPSVVILMIATLNPSVGTEELYVAGRWVFLLVLIVWLLALRTSGRRITAGRVEVAAFRRASKDFLVALVPALVVLAAFALMLGPSLNVYALPALLPWILVATARSWTKSGASAPRRRLRQALAASGSSAAPTVGALIALMMGTVLLGAVIERSGALLWLEGVALGPWALMGVLVLVLMGMGMVMDPLGAVLLTTLSLAPLATRHGIAPVHFWMTVLAAFELGYLSPPVAVNQLLARRVAGRGDDLKEVGRFGEHIWLPAGTMLVVLLVVAFGPLIVS